MYKYFAMAKLSNEEIKFILSLDAKGLQSGIAGSGKSIEELTAKNKRLQQNLKDGSKQLIQMEKDLAKMAAAGKESSDEYEYLSNKIQSGYRVIGEYREQINLNNEAIDKHSQKIKEMTDSLDLGEMTMDQLTRRSKELSKQLSATSYAADPEEYTKLQNELSQTGAAMVNLKNQGKSTIDVFSQMPHPVGTAVRAVRGFFNSISTLWKTNPLLLLAGIIISIISALGKMGTSSEANSSKMKQAMAPILAIWGAIKDVIDKVVGAVLDFINNLIKAAMFVAKFIPGLGKLVDGLNEKAQTAIQLEKDKLALKQAERKHTVEQATMEKDIAELRRKAAEKDVYSAKERLQFLDDVLEKEEQIADKEVKMATERLRIAKESMKQSGGDADTETLDNIAQLETAVIKAQGSYDEKTRGLAKQRQAFLAQIVQEQKESMIMQLDNIESHLDDQVLAIRRAGTEQMASENEINIAINEASQKSYQDRLSYLQQYIKKISDPKLRSEITKMIASTEQAGILAQKEADDIKLSMFKNSMAKELSEMEQSYKKQAQVFDMALATKAISQEEYNILSLNIEKEVADARLAILQTYHRELENLDLSNALAKKEIALQIDNDITEQAQKSAMTRAKQERMLIEAVDSFRIENNLMTADQELEIQQRLLDEMYLARIDMLKKEGLSTLELTEAYEQAKTNLILDHERRRHQLRQQIGQVTWQEEFEMQKRNLQEMLDNNTIAHEDYEKALYDLRVQNAKQWFDYYKDLFSTAIDSLKKAEMDSIDARYGAQIAAAANNAQEQERLEQEKAQKKLDIEKKYADVQFGIKASEIIANTAVAVMTAFRQLGPIAGAIAAALMATTGAAQLMSANAERRKVKSMTLSGGSSSASVPMTRVVNAAEEGGYSDVIRAQDGKRYRARNRGKQRGYIDDTSLLVSENGGEFVANAQAVSNPDVKHILDVIDVAQRGGYVKELNMRSIMSSVGARGLASGGYASQQIQNSSPPINPESGYDDKLLKDIYEVLDYLKRNGVKTIFVLSELQKMMALQEESDNLGSKNVA